jgi:hypothetical protein
MHSLGIVGHGFFVFPFDPSSSTLESPTTLTDIVAMFALLA